MSAIQFQSGGDCSPQPLRRGWGPRRGCGTSCSVQLRGPPPTAGFQGTQCCGSGSDRTVLLARYGACKVTQSNRSWPDACWQLEIFMFKEILLSVTAIILVFKRI